MRNGIHIQHQEKIFGPNFLLAFLCNVCVISNLVFFLFFNRYLEKLGASEAQIGLYMGALAFGSVAVRPLVGTVIDNYGRRRLIFFGILFMMAATTGYFLFRGLNWTVLVVRVLHGAGFGCYITGIFTIIVDDAPVTRRAKVIGVFGLSGMTTYAIFPMMAEAIIKRSGFYALFATALFALAAGLTLSLFLKEQDPVRIEFPQISFIKLLAKAELFIPLAALFFFCTGVGALINFIAVYLAPMKLSISFFFVASSLAGVFVRFNLGDLADIYGRRKIAFPAFTAASLALFWLGSFHYRWELVLSGLLYGIGIGLAVPAVAALIVDRVKPQDRGKGLALFTASFDFGVMAGSFAYGVIAGFVGIAHMYYFASAVMLISAVIVSLF